MPERYTAAPKGTEEFIKMLNSPECSQRLRAFQDQLAAVCANPETTGSDPHEIFNGLFANLNDRGKCEKDVRVFLGRFQEVFQSPDTQNPEERLKLFRNLQRFLFLSEIPGFKVLRSLVKTELGRLVQDETRKSASVLFEPEQPHGKPGLHEPNL